MSEKQIAKLYKFNIKPDCRAIEFAPWYGELGWEIMSWAPTCRKIALDYDQVIVSGFEGMAPLYEDFATEFRPHGKTGRTLDYPKAYRPDGIYYRYGRPQNAAICQEVLIHARGISRKNSINYRKWPELIELFTALPLTVGFIGSKSDDYVPGCYDFRGIDLQKLMDRIAKAKLVVGVSSGIMHLAAACGTDLVVWGDSRTYFSETLEKRYKLTWNPFSVKVGWIKAENWQPEPKEIIRSIEQIL